MEKRPILIIGALNSELNYLIEKLENRKQEVNCVYKFYKGEVNKYPVVIAKSEVGLVNASACLTIAIEKYDPILILNPGTAGGIIETRHKKDIILGEECFNILSSKTPYKEYGEGSDSTEWDLMTFSDGGTDEKKMYYGDKRLIKIIENLKENYKHGKLYKGVVGSADVWNREKDKLKYLSEKHNVSCEDMELIAIYTIANNYKIPALGIKIMSDNELIGEDYEPLVATYCQEFSYEALKEVIKNISDFE